MGVKSIENKGCVYRERKRFGYVYIDTLDDKSLIVPFLDKETNEDYFEVRELSCPLRLNDKSFNFIIYGVKVTFKNDYERKHYQRWNAKNKKYESHPKWRYI